MRFPFLAQSNLFVIFIAITILVNLLHKLILWLSHRISFKLERYLLKHKSICNTIIPKINKLIYFLHYRNISNIAICLIFFIWISYKYDLTSIVLRTLNILPKYLESFINADILTIKTILFKLVLVFVLLLILWCIIKFIASFKMKKFEKAAELIEESMTKDILLLFNLQIELVRYMQKFIKAASINCKMFLRAIPENPHKNQLARFKQLLTLVNSLDNLYELSVYKQKIDDIRNSIDEKMLNDYYLHYFSNRYLLIRTDILHVHERTNADNYLHESLLDCESINKIQKRYENHTINNRDIINYSTGRSNSIEKNEIEAEVNLLEIDLTIIYWETYNICSNMKLLLKHDIKTKKKILRLNSSKILLHNINKISEKWLR